MLLQKDCIITRIFHWCLTHFHHHGQLLYFGNDVPYIVGLANKLISQPTFCKSLIAVANSNTIFINWKKLNVSNLSTFQHHVGPFTDTLLVMTSWRQLILPEAYWISLNPRYICGWWLGSGPDLRLDSSTFSKFISSLYSLGLHSFCSYATLVAGFKSD